MKAQAKLYVIPGSHPATTARLMLEHKGVGYKRVDLMPVVSRVALRALGFPGRTVPALKLDGRRVQGSREIARELDRIAPEPALLPADPTARHAVEEAEQWGDEVLQPVPRRILWWCLVRRRDALRSFAEGARLGLPIGLAVKTAAPIVRLSARLNHAGDAAVQADLKALPELLDRVDYWIEEGVIGGEIPNAADFQIATSIALLRTLDDLRPATEGRPLATVADRLVSDYPGRVPPVLPEEWLEPLRQASTRESVSESSGLPGE